MYKYQLVLLVENINIYQTPKKRPGLSEDIAEIYLTCHACQIEIA